MISNLEATPSTSDTYSWADYIELRALVHPDKCYTRGEFASLLARNKSSGGSVPDAQLMWADVRAFVRGRQSAFGAAYPFLISQDEDTIELIESPLTNTQLLYLTLLLCSSMAYLNAVQKMARVFEDCSLEIFRRLMPTGSEVHPAWAGAGVSARYRGTLPEKYKAIAEDIRAVATFKDRDFKPGDHGDGGIDIVAWHPMGDARDAIPAALAQCGCSREDWRRKHLEASPAKLRAKMNPHHAWATYYFMPIDLRWSDGDWANKSDFGDAIMVDRLRLVNLHRDFGMPLLPLGAHVDVALALQIM
ncbi:hypothetical protein HHL11_02140 [Ramlibacter sp. G-1-2-2]|uniref:Uncharacterized protein n=1 Tax=Ramlibacter agri TaxID=2728837 RepID=A0A848GYR1_9BURK|nr:hypothetical protein [Ramlibacter agri]NML42531.1 hypothetical protein [Ramlibacter agri]